MKIFDFHIHSCYEMDGMTFDARVLLENMEAQGIDSGSVISGAPKYWNEEEEHTPKERLDELLRCCEGYQDRLYPVLWVHPDEEGTDEIVEEAAERGIKGFKIICNNFYVYEDKSMALLEKIAKTNKPVLFHSGILWDDTVSCKYNRPLHWEAVCRIPGLRFALAHCSWPWYDEAIALYGKLWYNHKKDASKYSEMFLDLTPGTPAPYRKDLFAKLFGCGYDLVDNLLWGSDNCGDAYDPAMTQQWLQLDENIFNEMGISQEIRAKIYNENRKRFFNVTD